jgi:transposase InsO family protein
VQKNRIIVTSVVVEGRSKAVVAKEYGVTTRWVHTLVSRYVTGGWEAIEPRSHTIAAHLERDQGTSPAVSTIWKVLTRHGLIHPEPKKRPRSSYVRFEADLPNETWQSDFTHWRIATGEGVEILTFIDDHSRLALSVTVTPGFTPSSISAFDTQF